MKVALSQIDCAFQNIYHKTQRLCAGFIFYITPWGRKQAHRDPTDLKPLGMVCPTWTEVKTR